MTYEEAKKFFLKNKSYCNIDLPQYFSTQSEQSYFAKAILIDSST